MTVRVNKDSFNLREKLSELERPIGLKGNELMSADTAQEARDLVSAGRKNMIINGDMSISQRGTSFVNPASIANGIYTLDRFSFQASNTNYTVSQDTTGPDGFSKSLKVTMGTATTLNFMRLAAPIEGYTFRDAKFGTPSAEYLTLSFWVKSSLTGTFAVGFRSGDTLTTNLGTSLVTTYDIDSPNVWEYKTVSIPPNTNGSVSWNTGTTLGMVIMWDLGDSASRCPSITSSANSVWQTADNYYPIGFDETVKLASSTAATWQITGVQLEVGKNATEFEHRSYGEELALCQRYYWEIGSYLTGNWAPLSLFIGGSATRAFGSIRTPVTMRAHPAITFSNLNLHSTYTTNITNLFRYSQTGRNQEYDGLAFEATTASGLVGGQVYRLHIKNVSGTSGYIRFNAEL